MSPGTALSCDFPLPPSHWMMVKHHLPSGADEPQIADGKSPPSAIPSNPQSNGSKLMKNSKNRVAIDDAVSSSSSEIVFPQKGIRIATSKRCRNPRFCVRRTSGEVEAIAFPLGMSIAAVLAQVLERKDLTHKASVDQLSKICSSAVRDSLSNVFGDKFDTFATNFEKSFETTLKTLRLVKNSSVDFGDNQAGPNILEDCSADMNAPISFNKEECSLRSCDISEQCSESVRCNFATEEHSVEEAEDREPVVNMNGELALQVHIGQQIAPTVSNDESYSGNFSMRNTIEKSVVEQTRANDLKSLEIGLIMRKLKMKETQLALSSDSNFLDRCKLYLGVSEISFKADKFKTQLEETRHSDLLRTCADFLVADLLIMSACLFYGVYAFSYDKIIQLTKSCSPPTESKSWWIPKPMSTFNSGLQSLNCQAQLYSRMLFGVLMILAVTYVLIQRSAISKHAMPVTFIVLLLGVGCGIAGKFCVETLVGDGNLWLIYWEVLCALHFFANVFTSYLFYILNGSIRVLQGRKSPGSFFPYWMRRMLFFALLILIPVLCGLLPFASLAAWKEHFSQTIRNHMLHAYDGNNDGDVGFDELIYASEL